MLSALGIGFLANNRVMAPLVALFLLLGLALLAWSARRHRHPGPLAVALAGSGAVVAGRLIWTVPAVTYTGSALIFGASIWNLYVRRRRRTVAVEAG